MLKPLDRPKKLREFARRSKLCKIKSTRKRLLLRI